MQKCMPYIAEKAKRNGIQLPNFEQAVAKGTEGRGTLPPLRWRRCQDVSEVWLCRAMLEPEDCTSSSMRHSPNHHYVVCTSLLVVAGCIRIKQLILEMVVVLSSWGPPSTTVLAVQLVLQFRYDLSRGKGSQSVLLAQERATGSKRRGDQASTPWLFKSALRAYHLCSIPTDLPALPGPRATSTSPAPGSARHCSTSSTRGAWDWLTQCVKVDTNFRTESH